MIFRKIKSTAPVVEYLYKSISDKLKAGQKILWVVPGGSSIEVVVAVAKKLQAYDATKLTVTLTDERYGTVGHKDSNWQQLTEAGFSLPNANLVPVLIDQPLPQTAQLYAKNLSQMLETAAYRIGFIGIGADGHAAGIKPKSPAVFSEQLAVGYRSPDFVRLTITPKTITMLDEVLSYAVGEEKWPILKSLKKTVPVALQPAQALKQVKKFYVYNDYQGEKV